MDKQVAEKSLFDWIELVERPMLHKAVKSLSIEAQIFISYIVKEGRTQRELSTMYKIAHQNISKKFEKIIKKLNKHLLQ